MKYDSTVRNRLFALLWKASASLLPCKAATGPRGKRARVEVAHLKHTVSDSIRESKLDERARRSLRKAPASPTYAHLLSEQKVRQTSCLPRILISPLLASLHEGHEPPSIGMKKSRGKKNHPATLLFIVLDSLSFDASQCKDVTGERRPDIFRQTRVRVRQCLLDMCQSC